MELRLPGARAEGVAAGKYTFHTFVVVGSLADVEATLRAPQKER